ncbi:glycosyltransferase [Rubrolithibacter danxiaensis]|uniref:glycosyltransferase n=1 Tax=Rubrolithibacter danxiaensis TaxID=3390805 RepID=UPI003BF7A155
MQKFAPIALFVYNRPEHTRRTLKFLQQNVLADESRLFVFSDGPKTPGDHKNVNEVRELIKDIGGFRSVEVVERPVNLGLANSIIDGVSKLVDEYGKVIVFEDDLISSPYTLQYFNQALQRYETNAKVMHIGAYMYPLQGKNLPQTFFYRAATSWGWATWKRAWKQFEPDIDKLTKQFDKKKINSFSIDGTMNFWKQMQEFKSGKNNSWAIRWYASIFLNGGLTLNPSRSLINNIGHDGTGVHSGINDMYHVRINPDPVTQFPEHVEENPVAYEAIKGFLRKRKGTFMQRVVRFIKGKFG